MTQEVNAYEALDLSLNGSVAEDLQAMLTAEGALSEVPISSGAKSRHANLTGAMRSWYDSRVAPVRHAAMDSIERVLESGDRAAHGDPIFFDREMHKLRIETAAEYSAAVETDRNDHLAEYERLDNVRQEELEASRKYRTLRARHDREPSEWNTRIYLFLLAFIGLAELAINWESFNAIEYFTPAIATGTALVIGLALATSSHFAGMTMRQFKARFDKTVDDLDAYSGMKMFGLSVSTLSIALGAVYYSRVFYFEQLIKDSWGIGEPVSQLKVIGGSMISNLLVWVVGVLIAYLAHDPDPVYPSAKKHLLQVQAKREGLQKRQAKRLTAAREKIDLKNSKKVDEFRNRQKQMSGLPHQDQANALISRIKAKDDQVISVLSQYRQRLMAGAGQGIEFIQKDEVTGEPISLTANEYSQQDLELHYG